jgi:hypothetical protein
MPRLSSSAAAARVDKSASSTKTGRNVSARSGSSVSVGLGECGVTEHLSACFGRCQCVAGALGYLATLLLCARGIDVEHERIDVRSKLSDDGRLPDGP